MKPKPIEKEHQELMSAIGEKIKEYRKAKKMSYIKMAKEVGISRNAYNLIENGNVYFNISSLLEILKFHNISLVNFLNDLDINKKNL